ncbi:hypothetical protein KUCAC02_024790, partial [Chaenocephalus aceratus]
TVCDVPSASIQGVSTLFTVGDIQRSAMAHTTHHMGNIISRKLSPNPVVPCEGIKAERKRKTQDLCTDSDGFTLDLLCTHVIVLSISCRCCSSLRSRSDSGEEKAGRTEFSYSSKVLFNLSPSCVTSCCDDSTPSQAGSGTFRLIWNFSGWIWNLLRLDLEPSQAGSGTFSGWIWNLLRLDLEPSQAGSGTSQLSDLLRDLEPSQAGSGTVSGWIWNLLRLSGGRDGMNREVQPGENAFSSPSSKIWGESDVSSLAALGADVQVP